MKKKRPKASEIVLNDEITAYSERIFYSSHAREVPADL